MHEVSHEHSSTQNRASFQAWVRTQDWFDPKNSEIIPLKATKPPLSLDMWIKVWVTMQPYDELEDG